MEYISSTQPEQTLLSAIQDGLPLTPRPYQTLAEQTGLTESQVIALLQKWQQTGRIKRFGLVVQHHRLGLNANAMVVWDIPACEVDAIGEKLSDEAKVTLCYRRKRQLPDWRYNLYCMVHGTDRKTVLKYIDVLNKKHDLSQYPQTVLFSKRQFKQRGARYYTKKH